MIKPNFFVVGAAKAGTTYLCEAMRNHPQVYVSPIKEPHFFCPDIRVSNFREDYKRRSSFDMGTYLNDVPLANKHIAFIEDEDQYHALFQAVTNEKAVGELSTGYLYSRFAAEELFNYNAKAKIVIVLRQPVERAYSHFLMDVRDCWNDESNFLTALKQDAAAEDKGWGRSPLYIDLGLYSQQVQRYLDWFPRSQVKILLFDELKLNSHAFIKELYDFLEVEPPRLSGLDTFQRENVAMLPKTKMLPIYYSAFSLLKKIIGLQKADTLKTYFKAAMFSEVRVRRLQAAEFDTAMQYFRDDIAKLSALIDRDLQDWYRISEKS